jgi:hypothetical protein
MFEGVEEHRDGEHEIHIFLTGGEDAKEQREELARVLRQAFGKQDEKVQEDVGQQILLEEWKRFSEEFEDLVGFVRKSMID